VIVIDEAQALSQRTLTELGLLLNLENTHGKLVQIVLAGQPGTGRKIAPPGVASAASAHNGSFQIAPALSLEETGAYIASRLRGAGGSGNSYISTRKPSKPFTLTRAEFLASSTCCANRR